jgi:molybdopterin converting factor subunit 1
MRVTVKLFAIARQRLGTSELLLELPSGATAGTALDALSLQAPADAGPLLARCALAVNREYVSRQSVLHDGDEVAVIPPVSGG